MNVFTAVTRIGADAEQRFTQGGDSVVSFNGAVDSGFGEKKVTTWIKFTLWGKRGTSVLPYLTKGAQVAVSGELANRKWQDKDGQDRYSLEVRVNELTLVGGKQEPAGYAADSKPQPAPAKKVSHGDDLDSDIPFVSNICFVSDMMGAPKSLRRSRRGESVQSLFGNEASV